MRVEDLRELQYITSVENVPSIMEHGLLSHRLAERYKHVSIANPSVQDVRARKRLPNGRLLHDYVNLYINARNPMMYVKVRNEDHQQFCVLRVDRTVIGLPGVIVADGNAATGWTRFDPPVTGLELIDAEALFAEYWSDGRKCCAEVLVPDSVEPNYIFGAYASCDTALQRIALTMPSRSVKISEQMFFQKLGVVSLDAHDD